MHCTRAKTGPWLFHVTTEAALSQILCDGLQPQIGERSAALGEPQPRIYLFAEIEALEDALLSWLDSAFDEHEALALLGVRAEGLALRADPAVGYEVTCTEPIGRDRLTLLSADLDAVMDLRGTVADKLAQVPGARLITPPPAAPTMSCADDFSPT